MQQNCRLTAIIISIMITVCIIFMIYGFILAFIFSASVIGFYIYYLIENKKKQTLFLKGISQKYKMKLIITSENVEENVELVPQKLRNQLL